MQGTRQFDFCTQLQQLLETRQAVGRTGKTFEKLGALSTENNLATIRSFMLDFKPEKTLEIGLAFGASCLAIAASHQDLNRLPDKQHIAIDPYQATVWDDTGRLAVEHSGLLGYVNVYEDFSHAVLPRLLSKGQKFDLIYIDGSHLFEDVFIDFFYSNKLLSKQGLLLFDDSSYPHVRKVLNFIDSSFSSFYEKLDLSYLYSDFKKTKYYLANLLRKNQLTAYRKIGASDRVWDAKFRNF